MHGAFRGHYAAMLYVGLVTLLTTPIMASAEQLAGSVSGLDCIEEIRIPRYDPLARNAALGGRIAASVVIGPDGRAGAINLPKAGALFTRPVQKSLEGATFKAECAGRTLKLIFVFEIREGPRVREDPGEVSFRAPNIFLIRAYRAEVYFD